MPEGDRLNRLEYEVARIARQIAGMPVRLAQTGGTGGGGGDSLLEVFYVVTEDITSSTHDATTITAGTGMAQQFEVSRSGDVVTAEAIGEPVDVWNLDPGLEYSTGTGIFCEVPPGASPEFLLVLGGFCSIYGDLVLE